MIKILLSSILAVMIAYTTNAQNYEWAKAIGGSTLDESNSIALDNLGNIYITGYFQGTADFDPSASVANLTSTGSRDVFFAKYDSEGNYVWAKNIGGSSYDVGYSIKVDVLGNVYVGGIFQGTADFDPSASVANLTSAGGLDAFFAKYDNNGNYVWSKNVGGSAYDYVTSIALDDSGNIYITGYFYGSSDFDPSASTVNLTASGDDVFFAKYDNDGNYIWAKNVGGSAYDNGVFIAVDNSGNVYLTGFFINTADFDPSASVANLTSAGIRDIFFAKYDNDGNYIWAKAIGGSTNDDVTSMVLDSSGNVYITGIFLGTADFDPSTSVENLTSSGFEDIFFAKYDNNGNYVWAKNVGGSEDDQSYSIALDASSNIYITGGFNNTADFDPSTANAYLAAAPGNRDVFFAKYDNNGNYIWAKNVGSSGNDYGASLVLDLLGNIYITGFFMGTVDFDPSTTTNNVTSLGVQDIFVAKYTDETMSLNDKNIFPFNLYPNPANTVVNINDVPVGTSLQITDLSGKKVFNTVIKTGYITINTGSLINGVYILKLTSLNGETAVKKLIIKN